MSALANVYEQWGSLPWGPTAKEVVGRVEEEEEEDGNVVFTVVVTYEGVGEGLVDSGVSVFELVGGDPDGVEGVVGASRTTVQGVDQLVIDFLLPVGSALLKGEGGRFLRYAYRNRPCPARKEETPYVGMWCGVYNSLGQPALPFVQDV